MNTTLKILCILILVFSAAAKSEPQEVFPKSKAGNHHAVTVSAETFYKFGEHFLELGHLEQAAQAYTSALNFGELKEPWRCYYRLAFIAASQDDLEKTKFYLDKAFKAEATTPTAP